MAQTCSESRVLICLYEYMCKDNCTRISQQEVAERVQLSRVAVNKHFQYLIYAGYIVPDEKYLSKYFITQKGIDAAKKMKKYLIKRGITTW